MGPVLAITCAFVFYILQLIFALSNQVHRLWNPKKIYFLETEMTFFMRSIYPVVTGFMSYVNPLVYLLFSDDLRKLLICFLRCRAFDGGVGVYRMERSYFQTPSGTNVRVAPSSAFSSTEVRQ